VTRWTKVKVATVVAIVVLSVLAAAFLWMAWDYRGAKNRAEYTLVIEMTNTLTTSVMRINFLLDDSNTVEGRSSEAWWANMMLDRLHWDALAVGAMYSDGSSTKRTFHELGYAFDELKVAVLQAQSHIALSGDIEESLNSGLETSMEDLYLVYQEMWDAMDKISPLDRLSPLHGEVHRYRICRGFGRGDPSLSLNANMRTSRGNVLYALRLLMPHISR
jgi:hypothetical protein